MCRREFDHQPRLLFCFFLRVRCILDDSDMYILVSTPVNQDKGEREETEGVVFDRRVFKFTWLLFTFHICWHLDCTVCPYILLLLWTPSQLMTQEVRTPPSQNNNNNNKHNYNNNNNNKSSIEENNFSCLSRLLSPASLHLIYLNVTINDLLKKHRTSLW